MPWSKPLARPLSLKNGRTLYTLHDVRDVFTSGVFVGVNHSPPLEQALDMLLKAAETGEDEDVKAATDQVTVALRVHRLI